MLADAFVPPRTTSRRVSWSINVTREQIANRLIELERECTQASKQITDALMRANELIAAANHQQRNLENLQLRLNHARKALAGTPFAE